MKKLVILVSIFVFVGVFGYGSAMAANPSKIKVGILLPLTGTFAAVAETQKEGALLAIDVLNKKGGLAMPWGKVKVEGVVADDEAKQDVGVRRYRYMVSEGVNGVGGQTWAPLAFAINAIVSKEPMPYFPVCVLAKDAFKKGTLAETTFATAFSPWTVGYMAGSAAVKNLGKKKIFAIGAGYDAQKDYESYAADAYVDLPVGTGGAVSGQLDWIRYDGGTTFTALPKQDTLFLEGGYYVKSAKVMPFFTYSTKDLSGTDAGDESRWSIGLGYMAFGHNLNVKAAYGKIDPKNRSSADQFTIQLQGFYF